MGPLSFTESHRKGRNDADRFSISSSTCVRQKFGLLWFRCQTCFCWFIVSFCHFISLVFSPRDDPVEDISAELLNWKEAALIGCSVGALLKAAGASTLCHAERLRSCDWGVDHWAAQIRSSLTSAYLLHIKKMWLVLMSEDTGKRTGVSGPVICHNASCI